MSGSRAQVVQYVHPATLQRACRGALAFSGLHLTPFASGLPDDGWPQSPQSWHMPRPTTASAAFLEGAGPGPHLPFCEASASCQCPHLPTSPFIDVADPHPLWTLPLPSAMQASFLGIWTTCHSQLVHQIRLAQGHQHSDRCAAVDVTAVQVSVHHTVTEQMLVLWGRTVSMHCCPSRDGR